jgi:hypothetical protein
MAPSHGNQGHADGTYYLSLPIIRDVEGMSFGLSFDYLELMSHSTESEDGFGTGVQMGVQFRGPTEYYDLEAHSELEHFPQSAASAQRVARPLAPIAVGPTQAGSHHTQMDPDGGSDIVLLSTRKAAPTTPSSLGIRKAAPTTPSASTTILTKRSQRFPRLSAC